MTKSAAEQKPILQEMRESLRRANYALSTERTYCDWVARFIKFHQLQSREALSANSEQLVEIFLTDLVVTHNVAPSTQNQALNALVYLYSKILKQPLENISASRSRKTPRIPVVLTQDEVRKVIYLIEGINLIVVKLLYGSGLRISEALKLRVQDVDFGYKQITVRDGKGKKDRVTPLAQEVVSFLKNHLKVVKALHELDLENGLGSVYLPYALAKKYPNAEREFGWQYVFPSKRLSIDPRSGIERRHHIDQSVVNKAIKVAVKKCSINKRVSAHTFRHSFATHLLQTGTDIRTIQSLLGHADLQTTMIYTHILKQGGEGVISPLDTL